MAQPARPAAIMTADEFLEYPLDDIHAELVRGELRTMPPPGPAHGFVGGKLLMLLAVHVSQHQLGRALPDGVGYELVRLPHTVRVPDVSFVRADRLPAGGVRHGLLKFAPDLAVEVRSPSDSTSDLEEKVDDYLVSGTQLVWVIDLERRTVMIVPADGPRRWQAEDDTLDGGTVVPGFSCLVSELFEGVARTD